MGESEDLPRILGPLAEDAAAAALGQAAALEQEPLSRELLVAAIEAAAPAVAKLRVSVPLCPCPAVMPIGKPFGGRSLAVKPLSRADILLIGCLSRFAAEVCASKCRLMGLHSSA